MNKHVTKLLESGLTPVEAADRLGLEVEDVEVLATSTDNVDEIMNNARAGAAKTIVDIANHGESEIARLKAAEIILESRSRGPQADRWKLFFEQMKTAVAAHV